MEEQPKQAVVFGRLDGSHFLRRLAEHGGMEDLLERGEGKWPGFKDLLADVYHGLYLYDPKLRDRAELARDRRANHDLLHQAMGMPAWEEARAFSTMDALGATYGVAGVAEVLLDELPEQPPQMPQGSEGQPGDGPPGPPGNGAGDEGDDGEEGDGESPSPALDADKLRRIARKMAETARDNGGDLASGMDAWGIERGELQAMPPEEALALFSRIRKLPNLRRFADELGRMREQMREAEGRPTSRDMREIVGVVPGRNLMQALPSERALLARPKFRKLLKIKMVQEALLTWEYAGREQANRGPLVVLVDVSGSTLGDRERWAKAFTLTCLDLAARQERPARVVFFDYGVRGTFDFTGRPSPAQRVQLAEFFTGGGTAFEPPLAAALEALERVDTYKNADVVLVTDGIAPLRPEFVAEYRKRAKDARTHGVLLDGPPEWAKQLHAFCDTVHPVRSFEGPRAAAAVFKEMT